MTIASRVSHLTVSSKSWHHYFLSLATSCGTFVSGGDTKPEAEMKAGSDSLDMRREFPEYGLQSYL